MRVIVTGAFGLVGPYVTEALIRRGWSVTTSSRRNGDVHADLTRQQDVRALLDAPVDAVINCAALTDVDTCERLPHLAWQANAHAVAVLVQHVPPTCHLVQISTDQVYPGHDGPHAETATNPVNVYGSTKAAGEAAARLHPITTVIRTNVFGPSRAEHRFSLSDWVVSQLSVGRTIGGFTDLLFSPVHLTTLAEAVIRVVDERLTGTFNVGSHGPQSKFEFARAVARRHGFSDALVVPRTSTEDPTRAPRPLDTRLDVSRFEQASATSLPSLVQEIER